MSDTESEYASCPAKKNGNVDSNRFRSSFLLRSILPMGIRIESQRSIWYVGSTSSSQNNAPAGQWPIFTHPKIALDTFHFLAYLSIDRSAFVPSGISRCPVFPSTQTVAVSQSGMPIDTSSLSRTPVSNSTEITAWFRTPSPVDTRHELSSFLTSSSVYVGLLDFSKMGRIR